MEFNNDDIASLGSKLDELDLSAGERSVLDAILAREDDTVGYGDSGFGLKIGRLIDTMGAKDSHVVDYVGVIKGGPIANGDLGSGRREA